MGGRPMSAKLIFLTSNLFDGGDMDVAAIFFERETK